MRGGSGRGGGVGRRGAFSRPGGVSGGGVISVGTSNRATGHVRAGQTGGQDNPSGKEDLHRHSTVDGKNLARNILRLRAGEEGYCSRDVDTFTEPT
jgi:hypothetical protein